LKSVVGAEYARLNTGGSITRGNSGNGALPTLDGKNVGNKKIAPNTALLLEDLQGGESRPRRSDTRVRETRLFSAVQGNAGAHPLRQVLPP
jgi:hypothetical protein